MLVADIGMMHIACFQNMSWGQQWLVQTFLPAIYPIICLFLLALSRTLSQLAICGTPLTRLLLRWGWRPRRDFSLVSIRDTYFPSATLFMHMYYVTSGGFGT